MPSLVACDHCGRSVTEEAIIKVAGKRVCPRCVEIVTRAAETERLEAEAEKRRQRKAQEDRDRETEVMLAQFKAAADHAEREQPAMDKDELFKLKIKKVAPWLILVAVSAFGVFVWPTRYRYEHVTMQGTECLVRIDRFSNQTWVWTPYGGWVERITRP
jgi:hypothetical protein